MRSHSPLRVLVLLTAVVLLGGVFLACGGGDKLDASLTSLKVGDCIDGAGEGNVTGLTTVDCGKAGAVTVIKVFDMPDEDTFPGAAAVDTAATSASGCPQTTVQTLGPTKDSWEKAHDRQVVCLAKVTVIDATPSPT